MGVKLPKYPGYKSQRNLVLDRICEVVREAMTLHIDPEQVRDLVKECTTKCPCAECGEEIDFGTDESTYCGSVHESCLEAHKEHCKICDED